MTLNCVERKLRTIYLKKGPCTKFYLHFTIKFKYQELRTHYKYHRVGTQEAIKTRGKILLKWVPIILINKFFSFLFDLQFTNKISLIHQSKTSITTHITSCHENKAKWVLEVLILFFLTVNTIKFTSYLRIEDQYHLVYKILIWAGHYLLF